MLNTCCGSTFFALIPDAAAAGWGCCPPPTRILTPPVPTTLMLLLLELSSLFFTCSWNDIPLPEMTPSWMAAFTLSWDSEWDSLPMLCVNTLWVNMIMGTNKQMTGIKHGCKMWSFNVPDGLSFSSQRKNKFKHSRISSIIVVGTVEVVRTQSNAA